MLSMSRAKRALHLAKAESIHLWSFYTDKQERFRRACKFKIINLSFNAELNGCVNIVISLLVFRRVHRIVWHWQLWEKHRNLVKADYNRETLENLIQLIDSIRYFDRERERKKTRELKSRPALVIADNNCTRQTDITDSFTTVSFSQEHA